MTAAERLALLHHELRAPVAALAQLAAAAPRARREGSLPALLALAVAAGRDVERILHDPSPDVADERRRVELAELVREAVGDTRGRIELVVEAAAEVEVDATRVRQALRNLVANGLRHGDRMLIVVGASADSAFVDLADDGAGVAPEIDPFARGVSSAGSSGLGLWVARTVATEHGGTLELREPGPLAGACFRLALPRASAAG